MVLFRSEAIENHRLKLYGEVLIPQHLPYVFLIGSLFLYFCLILLIAVFGTYTRSEQAIGYLVPTNGLIKISPTQPGIISNIYVQNRQLVKAGDLLVSIKLDHETQSGVSPVEEGITALNARIALLTKHENLLISQFDAKAVNIRSEISTEENAILGFEKRLIIQAALIKSAKEIYENSAKLIDRGYISRMEAEKRKQAFLTAQQLGEILKQELSAVKGKLIRLKNSLEKLPIDLAERTNRIESEFVSLSQNKLELEGKRSYVIKAPVSGRVASLVGAIGRNTNPSIPLLTLLPEYSELIAEIFVPSRAIGFVTDNQNVRLAFDAFPYERFGSVHGRIISVSDTILRPIETGAAFEINEPVYRVTVILDTQYINYQSRKIALQPGLQLSATIILEKMGLFDWITAPLKAIGERL